MRKGRTPEQTIVRQVRTGLLVSEDGSVPLLSESFDGNREDTNRKDGPRKRRLAALDEATLRPLTYQPQRHKGEPRYLACEHDLALGGVRLRAL